MKRDYQFTAKQAADLPRERTNPYCLSYVPFTLCTAAPNAAGAIELWGNCDNVQSNGGQGASMNSSGNCIVAQQP